MRSFTLVELMIVIAIVSLLAAIAIPAFAGYSARAKWAEVPVNTDGISTAAASYQAEHGAWRDCNPTPTAPPGKKARPFAGGSATCFSEIGWTPDGAVYATYETRLSGAASSMVGCECTDAGLKGACAYAKEDVDGDAKLQMWRRGVTEGVFDDCTEVSASSSF